MPRLPRVVAVGYPHHLTQRGNNREHVFLDHEDFAKYLELLKYFSEKHDLKIWAYCLMPNHVHLLVVPGSSESLAKGVGSTNLTYTQYFNRKYERSGRIWQNRFYSCIVGENDYLLRVVKYIEMNPVKAEMVKVPQDYFWSSARAHCGGVRDPLLANADWFCDEVRSAYQECIRKSNPGDEKEIRRVTMAGRVFGGDALRLKIESELHVRLTGRPRGRPSLNKQGHF